MPEGSVPRGGREPISSDRARGIGHKLKHGAPSEYQETFFHSESDCALAQDAQQSCGVTMLRRSQKPSGHGQTGGFA